MTDAVQQVEAFFAQRDNHVRMLEERRRELVAELDKIDNMLSILLPPTAPAIRRRRHGDQASAIIDYLQKNPGSTTGQVGVALGGTAPWQMSTMAVRGTLVRRKKDGGWRYFVPLQPATEQASDAGPKEKP